MQGLVSYDDDSLSEPEAGPSSQNLNVISQQILNDNDPKHQFKQPTEARRTLKSQVIIKRPSNSHRNQHPRTHTPDDPPVFHRPNGTEPPLPATTRAEDLVNAPDEASHPPFQEEMLRIRQFLKPPPIPDVEDWEIPAESSNECDVTLRAKITQFCTLKNDPTIPKHFNDSLMSNRSFRNPHLYTKLVEFVNVDERTTNFPTSLWDPNDNRPEWFANRIAETQRERSEKQTVAQAPGKRSRIDFSVSGEKEHLQTKKSRLQIYNSRGSVSYARDRQRTRLG